MKSHCNGLKKTIFNTSIFFFWFRTKRKVAQKWGAMRFTYLFALLTSLELKLRAKEAKTL